LTWQAPQAVQDHVQVNGWSDGLPVIPPAPELVEEFIGTSMLDPGEVVVDLR